MHAIGTVRTLNSSIDTIGWDRKGYRMGTRQGEEHREGKEQVVYTVYIILDRSSARSEDGWVGLSTLPEKVIGWSRCLTLDSIESRKRLSDEEQDQKRGREEEQKGRR
jgi:hypothetical protein